MTPLDKLAEEKGAAEIYDIIMGMKFKADKGTPGTQLAAKIYQHVLARESKKLKNRLKKLNPYIHHHRDCKVETSNINCTCGLDAALEKARAK